MRDWELVDSDRFSFEDSDRFEEDSLCSWISEPESLCNNWRGWRKSNYAGNPNPVLNSTALSGGLSIGNSQNGNGGSTLSSGVVPAIGRKLSELSLVELSARCVASHIPFELVERVYPPVPEQLQLRIAFWSFPEHEEDIRLYSCLANGSSEEFQKGEKLFKNDCVSDILQIGFHLSANVKPSMRETHKVAVTFDRRRIVSCTCTCIASTNWCGHVVAVCLHRIFQCKDVKLRAPVSESLSRLHRDQLQKFAQYLISELPQQILPTAQRLLDELLSSQRSAINTLRGAPDPTAGASANEQTTWFLDEKTLHGNIHRILIKFCIPAPIVFSDVNYLGSAPPPASAEWSSLLRPLRGREPEGMWNLLSIVREMFRREDRNAIPLLEIITEECLNCDQILVWWFNTKVALHNGNAGHGGKHHSVNSNSHACQHAGSSLCDEIVALWRLAALNPGLSPEERRILISQFKEWHMKVVENVSKSRNAPPGSKQANTFKNDVEVFSGFRPSIEACFLTWDSYPIEGVTYSESSRTYLCPFMCFRHSDGHSRSGDTGLIHSSHAILNNHSGEHHLLHSSATVSSGPLISKRPRSVDFAVERNANAMNLQGGSSSSGNGSSSSSENSVGRKKEDKQEPTTSSQATSSSTAFSNFASSSKTGNKQSSTKSRKSKKDLPSNFGVSEVLSSLPKTPNCMSASGLKIKNQDYMEDGSFQEGSLNEVPGPCPQPAADVQASARDGSRSSISSEGFCDEIEPADADPPQLNSSSTSGSILTAGGVGMSDEYELENYGDLDADSDSSFGARVPTVLVKCKDPPAQPSSSDSQNSSGDEYHLYYFDVKAASGRFKGSANEEAKKKDSVGANVFSNLKKIEDAWDVLFARAEGLHAHGHSKEACKLGIQLAEGLLKNPPDLSLDVPITCGGKGKKKKINPVAHQISCLASATLSKCSFLCTVLAENSDHYYLAFQVGMFGLELARPPASTKPLEVKLANQEAELAQLLKRIPIRQMELQMIRAKAEALRNGTYKPRGEALLPLVLANFIFETLVMPSSRDGRYSLQSGIYHNITDEKLGFEAAVSALGLKANVSEADHPLLCEGTRRQRGDLALAMLLHYKDDPENLSKVMDKLLDREIHQLYKAPLPAAYYSNNPPTCSLLGTLNSKMDESTNKDSDHKLSGSSSKTNNNRAEPSSTVSGVGSGGSGTESEVSEAVQSGSNNSAVHASAGSSVSSSNQNTNASTASASVATNTMSSNGRKEIRYKGKRSYPVLPNQPSEAGAHFMFELAKIVLSKAGGSSNQSLFTQPSTGQNLRGPHRALHMCAFHIELYAIGLHNAVSPNWLSRTYSSHVSWIAGQAMEIGAPAIAFLIETWENHLTPNEAAAIADRASRGDANTVRAAGELALSCLPFAHALNPNEIHLAILQCKEQSDSMLEKACLTVEAAAKGGGVFPEVLFDVARQWYSLYQKHVPLDMDVMNEDGTHHDSLLSFETSLDPLNQIGMGQQNYSPQTGLPPGPPNNSAPPIATSGPPVVQGRMEMIQLPPSAPQPHNAVFPVPMATIQYANPAAYGQVPVIPAFGAVANNFVYGQAVIYQPNNPNSNVVPTTSGPAYYAPQVQATQGNPSGTYSTFQSVPPNHGNQGHNHHHSHQAHSHSHSMLPANASAAGIQYYQANAVSTSTAGGASINMRQLPNAQFYSPSMPPPPSGHPNPNAGPQVAAVLAAPPMGNNHNGVTTQIQMMSLSNNAQPAGAPLHQLGPGQHYLPVPPPQYRNNHQMSGGGISHHSNYHHQNVNAHLSSNSMSVNKENNTSGNAKMGMGKDCGSMNQHMQGNAATKIKYLLASYRVGMLALETLGRKVLDDRPQAKFGKNPTYGEDVKWLLSIARKLGAQYLQQFCICAVNSLSNPFVLHEIILDASLVSSRTNLSWVYQNPRSPLAPLVQKCQQMYINCLHQKLYHISPSDFEDFVSIVCTARTAFHLTQDGVTQFKEFLQALRRSKTCKKDLYSQITQALQANPK